MDDFELKEPQSVKQPDHPELGCELFHRPDYVGPEATTGALSRTGV